MLRCDTRPGKHIHTGSYIQCMLPWLDTDVFLLLASRWQPKLWKLQFLAHTIMSWLMLRMWVMRRLQPKWVWEFSVPNCVSECDYDDFMFYITLKTQTRQRASSLLQEAKDAANIVLQVAEDRKWSDKSTGRQDVVERTELLFLRCYNYSKFKSNWLVLNDMK